MKLTAVLAACGLASAAAIERAAENETDIKYYYLKTQVTPGQAAAKSKYSNLYLYA
jgi:hypothetical protein